MARLRYKTGQQPTLFDLSEEGASIGRGAPNSIPLADGAASNRHGRIRRSDDHWVIEDLGSRNGTYVNGRPVARAALTDGDEILIGATRLVFEDPQTPRLVIDDSLEADAANIAQWTAIPVDSTSPPAGDASPLSPSIVRTELFDAQDTPLLRAERKLRLIQYVGEKLARAIDPVRMWEEILSLVVEHSGADRGFLCLLDAERRPVPVATRGIAPGEPLRVSRTVLARVLDERSGVLLNPVQSGDMIETLQDLNVVSTLWAPLWIGDEIIGLLSVDSLNPLRLFTEADLDMLLATAHQAAMGIERTRLAEEAEKERRLRGYLSKYLDDKVIAQIARGTGAADPLMPEQRDVTVLFADIVAFTKMSEGVEPGKLAAFVSQYLTDMTEIIFAHDGTIDKYIGDAVMALFGAPVASDDSPQAAIRAALNMRRQVRTMTPPGGGRRVRVAIGINTGPAVVGNIGSPRRTEYTAIGDAVNVAARLQQFARPDEICIDEVTKALAGDAFDVEEIGTIDVKNRAQPIVVYRVLGER